MTQTSQNIATADIPGTTGKRVPVSTAVADGSRIELAIGVAIRVKDPALRRRPLARNPLVRTINLDLYTTPPVPTHQPAFCHGANDAVRVRDARHGAPCKRRVFRCCCDESGGRLQEVLPNRSLPSGLVSRSTAKGRYLLTFKTLISPMCAR